MTRARSVSLQQMEGDKEQTAVLTDVFQADQQSPVEIERSTEQGHTIAL